MPDPILYVQALVVAGAIGACLSLVSRYLPAVGGAARAFAVNRCIAILVAAVAGLALAGIRPRFPPHNALDRLLLVLLPAALLVEGLTAVFSAGPRWRWAGRLTLAFCAAPVLLYGSVYLQPDSPQWSIAGLFVGLVFGGGASWMAVEWLGIQASRDAVAQRATAASVGVTIWSAGVLVLMGGYIKGGAAAFPLAGTAFGLALVLPPHAARSHAARIDVTWSLLGLFGVVFVGRFFGGLTNGTSLLLASTPVIGACVARLARGSELAMGELDPACDATTSSPVVASSRRRTRWAAALQLLVVAAVLGVLLTRGYAQFRQKLGRLAAAPTHFSPSGTSRN